MLGIGEMRGIGRVGFGQTTQRYCHTEVVPTLGGQLTLTKSGGASGNRQRRTCWVSLCKPPLT